MWKATAVTACAAAAVALLTPAAPASADAADFLHRVQPRYVFMTAPQLLAAGYRACAIIEHGDPSSDAVEQLDRELGIGVPVAFDIVQAAVIHLGC